MFFDFKWIWNEPILFIGRKAMELLLEKMSMREIEMVKCSVIQEGNESVEYVRYIPLKDFDQWKFSQENNNGWKVAVKDVSIWLAKEDSAPQEVMFSPNNTEKIHEFTFQVLSQGEIIAEEKIYFPEYECEKFERLCAEHLNYLEEILEEEYLDKRVMERTGYFISEENQVTS